MIKISGIANQNVFIGVIPHEIGSKVEVETTEDKLEFWSEVLDNVTIHNSEVKEVIEKPIVFKEISSEKVEKEDDLSINQTVKKQVNRKNTKKIEDKQS